MAIIITIIIVVIITTTSIIITAIIIIIINSQDPELKVTKVIEVTCSVCTWLLNVWPSNELIEMNCFITNGIHQLHGCLISVWTTFKLKAHRLQADLKTCAAAENTPNLLTI
jgi:hypothetical protein